MNILVTGGCGFIGSNLVPVLLEAGHRVRVLDNLIVGSFSSLAGLDVEFLIGDVRNADVVCAAVREVEAVIHLAAQTGVSPSQQNPRFDFEVNAGGTLGLLLASQEAGVRRFVFASSNAPIGDAEPPVNETQAPRPLSPYGASKLAGEGYCSAFYGSYGLQTLVLRFANVYGPRSSHKESIVARFVKDTLDGKSLTIFGDGQQTRDLIHVSDVCAAIGRALGTSTAGQVIQLATGVETKIMDLAHLVAQALGRPDLPLSFCPPRPGEIRRSYACIDRARQLLNWIPMVPVTVGVPQTCQWFLEQQVGIRK